MSELLEFVVLFRVSIFFILCFSPGLRWINLTLMVLSAKTMLSKPSTSLPMKHSANSKTSKQTCKANTAAQHRLIFYCLFYCTIFLSFVVNCQAFGYLTPRLFRHDPKVQTARWLCRLVRRLRGPWSSSNWRARNFGPKVSTTQLRGTHAFESSFNQSSTFCFDMFVLKMSK